MATTELIDLAVKQVRMLMYLILISSGAVLVTDEGRFIQASILKNASFGA